VDVPELRPRDTGARHRVLPGLPRRAPPHPGAPA
jgi:hypothetical protein